MKVVKLKDSGKRTNFASGAMKEIDEEEKGRCDLVYNAGWADAFDDSFYAIMEQFTRTGLRCYVINALQFFVGKAFNNIQDAYLAVAKHYAAGAKKYDERNMEKGYPYHCIVDSTLRHYTKWLRGDADEPHDRAVVWNLLTLLYMMDYKSEMNDLPKEN